MTLKGMKNARLQMARIERGVRLLGENEAIIYSNLPYAYGQETGRHRKGGLARRSGGARYMRQAADSVASSGEADIAKGLSRVTAPGLWVLRRLGAQARRQARKNAPKSGIRGKKYRLWKSIKSQVRKK